LKKRRKKGMSKFYEVQTVLLKKIVKYRKESKRSKEMNFVHEDWYIELKEKEQILHKNVADCVEAIRELGRKIDSLHRPPRVPYKTPRGPKNRGRKRRSSSNSRSSA
jgi:hypothetical protein